MDRVSGCTGFGGLKRSKKSETRARQERSWRQVARIVGAGLFHLPEFFRTGLYKLIRGGLADAEILRAFERCRAWLAKAKNGIGECECGCGTKRPVGAVNKQGNRTGTWTMTSKGKRSGE